MRTTSLIRRCRPSDRWPGGWRPRLPAEHTLDASAMVCLIRLPAARTLQFTVTSPSLPLGLAFVAGALEAAGRASRWSTRSARRRPGHPLRHRLSHRPAARRGRGPHPRRRRRRRHHRHLHARVAGRRAPGPADQGSAAPTCGSSSAASTSPSLPGVLPRHLAGRRPGPRRGRGDGGRAGRRARSRAPARTASTASPSATAAEIVVNAAPPRGADVDAHRAARRGTTSHLNAYHEHRYVGGIYSPRSRSRSSRPAAARTSARTARRRTCGRRRGSRAIR